MARSHARILLTIWADGDWKALPMGAQWLYELLLSQPDTSQAGILSLAERRWARCAADVDQSSIALALKTLSERDYVIFDEDTEECFVRSFMRNDGVARQPNTLKNAIASLLACQSRKIRAAGAKELARLDVSGLGVPAGHKPIQVAVSEAIEVLSSGPETPSPNPGNVSPSSPKSATTSDGYGDPIGEPYGEGIGVPPGEGEGVLLLSNGSTYVGGSVGVARTKRATPRGTRLPEDWQPTPEMITWAQRECPAVNLRYENDQFRDYWHAKAGKDAAKLDWRKTWQGWMRRTQNQAPTRTRGNGQPMRSTTDDRVAAIQAMKQHPPEQPELGWQPRAIEGGRA